MMTVETTSETFADLAENVLYKANIAVSISHSSLGHYFPRSRYQIDK